MVPTANRGRGWLLVWTFLLLTPGLRAADGGLGLLHFSIQDVPADATFYSAQLRNREIVEAIARSKAWAKLVRLPIVQMAVLQWNQAGPGGEIEKWYQAPENQELVALLGEALGKEVFVYGGAHSADFAQFTTEVVGAARYGPLFIQLSGQAGNLSRDQLTAASMYHVLEEWSGKLQVPELVLGTKPTKVAAVGKQLKRFEEWAKNNPNLKDHLRREKVAGSDFLVLRLDGKQVPWADLLAALKDYETKPGDFDVMVKKLSAKKLTVAIGVHKGYLLVSLGATTAPLEKFGQGKRLADRPELKPVGRFADRPLTSVSYLSKAMNAAVGGNKNDLDNFAALLEEPLQKADLPAEKKDRIRKDVKGLIADESYDYNWTENPTLDGSKPLTVLNHVGGAPVFFTAGRSRILPDLYPTMVKWLKVFGDYESVIVSLVPEGQREQFRNFSKAARPLLKQLDATTAKLLLPALQDGQWAFALDGRLTSKQWFAKMPPSEKPLPLLEPAWVLGLSDAAKFEKAFSEYRKAMNQFLVAYRKLEPGMPEFEIPPPQTRKLRAGTAFFYPLPEVGLDPQLLPNAAVGNKLAVLTLSTDHSERLLAETPLQADGLLGKARGKPLAGATHLNWPALFDALMPWVEWGVRTAGPLFAGGDEDRQDQMVKGILDQVRDVADLLKVFRSYSSITYVEGGAVVTHSETVIRDLR